MLLLCHFLALVAHPALAAPANSSQLSVPVSPTPNATVTGFVSANTSLTDIVFPLISQSNNPSVIAPITHPLTTYSISPSSAAATFLSFPATIFVTEVVTAFQTTTIDEMPSSASVLTVMVTETATTTVAPTKTSLPSLENRNQWVAPPQMTDLSAFNITYFPTGQRNLHIVSEIPSEAFALSAKFLQSSPFTPLNASTILQLVYPAHSVNPSNKPAGGADFYATPLDLSGARNVTLTYSVFFPADFDWVKGGKLPGLFGGHTGCSGGASARDCFSTRLMWRPQGVGELYLYAPKDKQSDALCADVASVCDVAYGFSIGRGTFNLSAGDWTHLTQNVALNTPGRNDGGFTLSVDGRVVIERSDMFYRDVMPVRRRLNVATPKGGTFELLTNVARHGTPVRSDEDDVPQPAEFLGLFFSTFFGGHGKQYATPRQQYTWFKDFAIIRHD